MSETTSTPLSATWTANRGLDLSTVAETTEAERKAFSDFYVKVQGRTHPGLEFFLKNAPETLKRYRAFADAGTPDNHGKNRRFTNFRFLAFYAVTGYVEGVRYLVHITQELGLTKAQVMEGLAIIFMQTGPRGTETVAEALNDYPWRTPASPPKFPDGWSADPAAFSSGIDFSKRELSAEEAKLIEAWYERTLGEVPGHVTFAVRYNPALLKAYRHRFETCVQELPKQVVPATLLHYEVVRAHADAIRENVLLAKGFGMTRDQVLEVIASALLSAGEQTLTTVNLVAGDILDRW